MDKTALVEMDINEGKMLIEMLDSTEFLVSAALWLYFSEPGEWLFVIASDYIDKEGPKKAYSYIQSILENMKLSRLSLQNISVLSTANDLIQVLSIAIKTGPGISGIRFTRNVINNFLIEDAYIYRVNIDKSNRS